MHYNNLLIVFMKTNFKNFFDCDKNDFIIEFNDFNFKFCKKMKNYDKKTNRKNFTK